MTEIVIPYACCEYLPEGGAYTRDAGYGLFSARIPVASDNGDTLIVLQIEATKLSATADFFAELAEELRRHERRCRRAVA